jgi:hypothetical protein
MGSISGSSSLDFCVDIAKTDLTSCIYQSDRPADPEVDQARLRPTHEQVLWCVTGSRVNRFLV